MQVTDRDQAYTRIQEMIDDGTLVPEQPRQAIHEHLAVLEAIEAGEPEQAAQRMRQHLANALQARLRIFTRLGTGIPAPGGREKPCHDGGCTLIVPAAAHAVPGRGAESV